MRALTALSRFVSASFPFWVLLFAILAFFRPAWFLPLTAAIAPLLGLVMFGMGLTLKGEDFREVARHPIRVLIGVLAQFVIMPGLAWLLCRLLQLPAEIAVGVILVGCCPGGTASNVMTWLSRGDVALSVAITSVTTLLAPLVTPALVWLLASAWLPVSFAAMFLSILQVVLVPIALGLLAQRLLGLVDAGQYVVANAGGDGLDIGDQHIGLGSQHDVLGPPVLRHRQAPYQALGLEAVEQPRQGRAFDPDRLGQLALGGRIAMARQMQQHQPARLGQAEVTEAAVEFSAPSTGSLG